MNSFVLFNFDKKNNMKTGVELIAEERQRQIEVEGWTSAHDDRCYSDTTELSEAAACYAIPPHLRYDPSGSSQPTLMGRGSGPLWPWPSEWWKPNSDRIKELQKAGALIAAEIDRLNRIKTH